MRFSMVVKRWFQFAKNLIFNQKMIMLKDTESKDIDEQDLPIEQNQVMKIALNEFLQKKKKISDSIQLSFFEKEDALIVF